MWTVREPGRGADDGRGAQRLVTHGDVRHALGGCDDACSGVCAYGGAARLQVRTGRLGIHLVERFDRKRERGITSVGPEHLREHARERQRRRAIDRLVQRRHRQRFPEQLHQSWRLAVADEPLLHGLARRGRQTIGAAAHVRTRIFQRLTEAKHRQAIAPGERFPVHDTGNQVQRRRQWRADETGPHAAPVDDRNRQRGLDAHVRFRADAAQEREGLVIAPEQDVLTVIHPLARLAIGERRGAAAKRRTRFEHEHARAAIRKRTRGAEAREAGANHNYIGIRHVVPLATLYAA